MFFFIKVVQLDATVAVVVSELLVKVFDRFDERSCTHVDTPSKCVWTM